ncbi:MAG TPA: glycosyltransferase family 4 protein [Abditibacterium sp.]|jgi:glycosyltransferase involved in cell wall biosynthesis
MNAPPSISASDLDFARILAQFEPEFSPDSPRFPVLYLNHSAQMSGAEASLRALLWGLKRLDLPFDPLVALPRSGPFTELLRREGWSVAPVPLRRLGRPHGLIDGVRALRYAVRTTPILTRLIEISGAKIVHSNSTTAHLVGGLAARRARRPAIWHCRDLVPLGALARPLAKGANRVIAISNCVAAHLEREGVPHDKIAVVYNGIDPQQWRPRFHSTLRDSLGLPPGAWLFGAVGQIVPWKEFGAFIEAAAHMMRDRSSRNCYFALIGGDLWAQHAAYRAELYRLVGKYGLSERFFFTGHQTDAADALSGLDALVHPTREEPFGRVILEAMALGKPVIAMNQNGPGEIITHERDGLLVPASEQNGLARAMKRLIRDGELRARLSYHAPLTIEAKFHSDDHARHIASIYREILR